MEEIQLHEQIIKNKCCHLKDIIFQCSGNIESIFSKGSGTIANFAIVYKHTFITCYTRSIHYGPGASLTPDNTWKIYKQYKLLTIPDIPFIVSELKKYDKLMQSPNGFQVSNTYGADLIINILKLTIDRNDKRKDCEIEHLKRDVKYKEQLLENRWKYYDSKIEGLTLDIKDRDKEIEQITKFYNSKIESFKLEIKDKDKEIEKLKLLVNATIKQEDEIHEADIKAKLFALKDKEAKERLRMLYEDNMCIEKIICVLKWGKL